MIRERKGVSVDNNLDGTINAGTGNTMDTIEEAADYLQNGGKEYIYAITCFSDKGKLLARVKEDQQ